MQCKRHDTEKNMEALQEVFDKALQENADLLNEKKQLEETQRETQQILQDFKTRKAELKLLNNEVKHKNTEVEEEKQQLEKKCRDMQCNIQVMVTKKYPFESVIQQSSVCKHRNSGGEATTGKITRRHTVFA